MSIWNSIMKFLLCDLIPIHNYKVTHTSHSKITLECVRCGKTKYKVIIW